VPLHFLASCFARTGVLFTLFLGVKRKEELAFLELTGRFPSVFWSCEEETPGGFCGDVITLLERHLAAMSFPAGTRVYACGPEGMLKALQAVKLFQGVPVEASFESLMGCGFGVCLSCGVERKNTPGYYHVCKDGPVFPLSEVKL
ncbi:MAG: hypothetical protein ACP5Q4_06070, partial [Candidatus Caldatribacteriaceae bacterium]